MRWSRPVATAPSRTMKPVATEKPARKRITSETRPITSSSARWTSVRSIAATFG
jgi:hypothetical protein